MTVDAAALVQELGMRISEGSLVAKVNAPVLVSLS